MFCSDPALTLYDRDKQQTISSHSTWETWKEILQTYYLKLIIPKIGNNFT